MAGCILVPASPEQCTVAPVAHAFDRRCGICGITVRSSYYRGSETVWNSSPHNPTRACRLADGVVGDGNYRDRQTTRHRRRDGAQSPEESSGQTGCSQPRACSGRGGQATTDTLMTRFWMAEQTYLLRWGAALWRHHPEACLPQLTGKVPCG